jgi:hypothetical protein
MGATSHCHETRESQRFVARKMRHTAVTPHSGTLVPGISFPALAPPFANEHLTPYAAPEDATFGIASPHTREKVS